MNQFFNSVIGNNTDTQSTREQSIKATLLVNLSENVKQIQFDHSIDSSSISSTSTVIPKIATTDSYKLPLSDSTQSLCTTIEAIFLHGLKDSLFRQSMNAAVATATATLSTIKLDSHLPDVNFWSFIKCISHQQTIHSINNELTQITNDIGRSRSWIRLILNDNLLLSYLSLINKNQLLTKKYYKNYAFLRDTDQITLAECILNGISQLYQFQLPYNSSLLNHWTYHPMQMAGIYTPPLRLCTIASGIDVVNSLTLDDDNVDVDDDDNDKIVLDQNIDDQLHDHQEREIVDKEHDEQSQQFTSLSGSNSLIAKNCWAPDIEINSIDSDNKDNKCIDNDDDDDNVINDKELSLTLLNQSNCTKLIDTPSSSDMNNDNIDKEINIIQSIWERFELSLDISNCSNGIIGNGQQINDLINVNMKISDNNDNDDETINKLGYEIVTTPTFNGHFSINDLRDLVEKSCQKHCDNDTNDKMHLKNVNEKLCKLCTNRMQSNVVQCQMTGEYFCINQCMSDEQFMIPSYVIYDWNFQKYSVSIKSAAFLNRFQSQSYLDFKLLNPKIYETIDVMGQLQSLRIKLNYIRQYLLTCCIPAAAAALTNKEDTAVDQNKTIIELFQEKYLWQREYMYEHIHRYSIGDLKLMENGELIQQLCDAVEFGRKHIYDCTLCSQKGFICEICHLTKALYPFDLETTFRCDRCGSVYHNTCLDITRPCPKCERKRKRVLPEGGGDCCKDDDK